MNIIFQGIGSYLPDVICDNAAIGNLVGGKWAGKPNAVARLLGMGTRYMMSGFTEDGFPDRQTDELAMAVEATSRAMTAADVVPEDIGLLIFVSGTISQTTRPDGTAQWLSKPAFRLHHRLGLPPTTLVEGRDRACAGFLFALAEARSLLLGDHLGMLTTGKKILVIVSNGASALANRKLYTETEAIVSLMVFGDGAGAVVLGASEAGGGIGGFYGFVDSDPKNTLISLIATKDAPRGPFASKIEGANVQAHFVSSMILAIHGLEATCPEARNPDYYLIHQPNGVLVKELTPALGINPEKIPLIVTETGNLSGAGLVVLLDRLIQEGRIKSGDRLVMTTIGDGVECGAMYYRVP